MSKINVVLSLKGGVGKTTLCAALAYNSACMGKRTLAVDMDFGVRSLDLAMGHQDCLSANVYDVIMKNSTLEDAVVKDGRSENLFFLSAPSAFDGDDLDEELFLAFLENAKRCFDEVYLDMAAGKSRALEICAVSQSIDCALVISSHNDSSIRAAEKLGMFLADNNIENINLIINSFNCKQTSKKTAPGIVEIIERSAVKLIGVVPFDEGVEEQLRRGEMISCNKKSPAGRATLNISRRLVGASVPLLEGVVQKKSRFKLY